MATLPSPVPSMYDSPYPYLIIHNVQTYSTYPDGFFSSSASAVLLCYSILRLLQVGLQLGARELVQKLHSLCLGEMDAIVIARISVS